MRGCTTACSASFAVEAETYQAHAVQTAAVVVVMQHVAELRGSIKCGTDESAHGRRRLTSLPTLLLLLKSPAYLQQYDATVHKFAAAVVHEHGKDSFRG
jgi:hypothetical protein